MTSKRTLSLTILFLGFNLFLLVTAGGKKSKDGEKPAWAKKDIRDYNEADLERLLDQWDVRFFFAKCSVHYADMIYSLPGR